MGELATVRVGNLPTQFNPENTLDKQSQADAIIAYAKKLRDWPLLREAVGAKVEEQKELIRWWVECVTPAKRINGVSVSVPETVISAQDATELTGFSKVQITRMRKNLADEEAYKRKIEGKAIQEAFSNGDSGSQHVSQGENDWYTPPEYIDAARDVMGGIDLDPASSDFAQITVKATEYFTKEDNGLEQDWHGRVWLNPPYSGNEIKAFVSKLLSEYSGGAVKQAVILTNNSSDTDWFHSLLYISRMACLTKGRIGFFSTDSTTLAARQGQCFFYIGDRKEKFKEIFSMYGAVVTL